MVTGAQLAQRRSRLRCGLALGELTPAYISRGFDPRVRPPPRLASPPLRPAEAARSRSLAKLRFSPGTLAPPLRAISRRRSGFIAAKPRRARGLPDSTLGMGLLLGGLLWGLLSANPRG